VGICADARGRAQQGSQRDDRRCHGSPSPLGPCPPPHRSRVYPRPPVTAPSG